MSQAKNRELSLLVTAGILAAFAGVDYWTPRASPLENEWLFALAYGTCIAQVTLIATWAVFAPGNIVVRLPWSLLLGLMMWYILIFGQRRAWGSSHDILLLGTILLLGVTVLQVPLWIAKRAFRYRMLAPGEVPAPAGREPMQFQLKHLMLGTFFLAVALSPIRLVLPKENVDRLMPDFQPLVVISAAVIVANLIATLPCLWGGFLSTHRARSLGAIWLVYGFVVTVVEFAMLCMILGDPHEARAFWIFCLLNFTQGALVFAVMRVYRTLGYSLQQVPRKAEIP